MPLPADQAAGIDPPLLDRRARPSAAQRFVIAIASFAAGAAAVWLAHAIDSDPQRGWGLALGAGAVIAALVAWFAMLGARVVIAGDGSLTYSLHGRPNLVLDLRDVAEARPIASGMLVGVGLVLADVQRVRFLHKAGISPDRMRRWRDDLGVDVLLEGFPPALAGELADLRVRLGPSAAGAVAAPA